MGTAVVFVTDSVGNPVFGRTRAMLHRASGLTRRGYDVHIATWSLKKELFLKFDNACRGMRIEGVGFSNLFDFFSEGDLRAAEDDAKADVLTSETGTYPADDDPCVRLLVDRQGRVLRKEVLRPDSETLLKTIFFVAHTRRPYLVLRHDEKGKVERVLWLRKDGTQRVYPSMRALHAYWLAAIDRKFSGDVIFVSELHTFDRAFFKNPYIDAPLTVVAQVNGTIYRKPYVSGSELNANNRVVVNNASKYAAIVAPTQALADELTNLIGQKALIRAIPYAAEEPVFESKLPKREKRRLALCCESDKSGRPVHAFEALSRLAAMRKMLVLDVYCSASFAKALALKVKELGLGDMVNFCNRRFVAAEDMPRYSALLSLDAYSGQPLALLQALQAGVPVIAYDSPFGPCETVEDGISGVLVEPGNIDALTDGIEAVVFHRRMQRKMSKAALGKAGKYGLGAVCAKWAGLFDIASSVKSAQLAEDLSLAESLLFAHSAVVEEGRS